MIPHKRRSSLQTLHIACAVLKAGSTSLVLHHTRLYRVDWRLYRYLGQIILSLLPSGVISYCWDNSSYFQQWYCAVVALSFLTYGVSLRTLTYVIKELCTVIKCLAGFLDAWLKRPMFSYLGITKHFECAAKRSCRS